MLGSLISVVLVSPTYHSCSRAFRSFLVYPSTIVPYAYTHSPMSSPARRLRTKTSDITDFFRGNGHGSHQSRQVQPGDPQIQVPAPLLEVPAAAQEKEISTSPKKRSTRIPFLGRTRKKSTQSVTAPTLPSTPESQSEIIDPVERTSTDQ